MKTFNALTPVFLLTFMFQIAFGQKISKKEAQQLLQNTLKYLKTGDTTAFANQWYFDNTGRPYNNKVFTRQDAVSEFYELKFFLDTALTQNLQFDEVEVENWVDAWAKYKVKYKIKGWFLYDARRKYYKGYGVLVDFVDGKWLFRFTFEKSTSYRS